MASLLFVDDDAGVLDALREVLGFLRPEWQIETALSGQAALALLESKPVDVVVSDLRMPGMDGMVLLTAVTERYPDTVRLIHSGYVEHDVVMRAAGVVHQYLAKPMDSEALLTTLGRALSLRTLLADQPLRSLLSSLPAVPSAPTLYTRLVKEARNARASLANVAEIVAEDPAMTAKILHLVNSPFFGRPRQVADPMHAVQLLGTDMVMALVLSAHIFGQFAPSAALDAAWRHSLLTNSFSRIVAGAAGADQRTIDEAAVAGLLHDIGQLVMIANRAADYRTAIRLAQDEGLATWEAEERVFGAAHMSVGGYLLGLWGLGDEIVEAVRFHHVPGAAPHRRFSALTAVHVANAFANAVAQGDLSLGEAVDSAYLREVGVEGQLSAWDEACRRFAEPTLRADAVEQRG